MKAGSCAAEPCEPGQVRKEAALSGALRVTQGCLAGAGGLEGAGERALDGGVHGHPDEGWTFSTCRVGWNLRSAG